MLPKTTSLPIINYGNRPLYDAIRDRTSLDLGKTLNHAWRYLSREDKEALEANAPADNKECTEIVDAWIARLQLIRSALSNFPTLLSPIVAPPAAHALTGPDRVTEDRKTALMEPVKQVLTPEATKKECLERDQYQCVMTGHKAADGFKIAVAYIIPPELANHPQCRHLDFWKMLDIFYGKPATDTLFAALLDRIHSLQNLVSLDNVIYEPFVNGNLILTPMTDDEWPMHPLYNHVGDYWLSAESNLAVVGPGINLSRLEGCGGEEGTLYQRGKVRVAYRVPTAGEAHPAALPSYFALRSSILLLKHICEHIPSWQHNLPSLVTSTTPTPLSSRNTSNVWSPRTDHRDDIGNDTVLGAIAILDEWVNAGDLS
ncbi:hypothetical protein HOY80DRAFT_1024927 [Tuber brumale]|nr:hypothetical protein HOY80DRAFT_1024927 [Tuber brumale]